jgi:hypothetical protein
LVFCGIGGRAAGAVTALGELGYSNVRRNIVIGYLCDVDKFSYLVLPF